MNKKVLVTGISGYVGQHCTAELLSRGYQVKGSLRDLSKKDEIINGLVQHNIILEDLSFCELDLLKDQGWEEAVKDCDYIMHVASPFIVKEPKNENELIKPAKEGTLRVLKAAQKEGVKRVVLTSSTVAMSGNTKNGSFDENTWTDETSSSINAYIKSKTIAEKTAWSFINDQNEQPGLQLTVINPGSIIGPTLTKNLNGVSLDYATRLITGKMPMLPKMFFPVIDVRDVARLHVDALENEKAIGQRFIAASDEIVSYQQIAQILKSNGYKKVSTRLAPSPIIKFMSLFDREMKGMLPFIDSSVSCDNAKTKTTFDWTPIPFEKSVLDMAESIKSTIELS